MRHDLGALQRFITKSVGEGSPLLTPEFMGPCLTSDVQPVPSSRTVKWVICKFNLQYNHIKSDSNALLFRLFSVRRNRCAQWLLDTFDIPLDDVVSMFNRWLAPNSHTDLAGWQAILGHYGDAIDASFIRTHFLGVVSAAPPVALFTMRRFGITLDEIRGGNLTKSLSDETKIWLGLPWLDL
ncbi:hypothetical protein Pelo_19143 [Pelomyxa schiedti]|nr:hypothetical protein Pelo_19143 [Pelomyxa schiedti]